jgi:phospholipid/cholesterol/gamma-HCH transport system substrate-binding protein
VRGSSALGRVAALIALGVAVIAIVVLLAGGGGNDYEVTATFENASQLVKGNQVVVGGTAAGTVKDIELGPDGQALVTFTVDDDYAPLKRGTTATVRSYSLSGIANRQIQLTLPPQNQGGAEIPSGGSLSAAETVSEVDLDQVFNTLDPATIRDFKHVIEGFAISYDGVGRQANRGFHYLNPFLSPSRRLFAELSYDQGAFESLITDTSRLSGALAEKAPEISALVHNLNLMMGALGGQKTALAATIAKLPDFMREADTTFVNLRSALDDVDPLVDASKPVARKLGPFLAKLRATAHGAVPTVTDLDRIVRRPGHSNDLIELTRAQVPLARAAVGSGSPDCGADPQADYQQAADDDYDQGAFGESVCALRNSLPNLANFRPYTPELVGWFNDFSTSSGYNDAAGGIGRIATTFNAFTISSPSGLPNIPGGLIPNINTALTTDRDQKCPGANERPLGGADPADDSVPFYQGAGYAGQDLPCDPTDVQPGP